LACLSRWENNFKTAPVGSHNRQDKAVGTVSGMGHVKTAGHKPMAKPCVYIKNEEVKNAPKNRFPI
jgi:hypothetical protein